MANFYGFYDILMLFMKFWWYIQILLFRWIHPLSAFLSVLGQFRIAATPFWAYSLILVDTVYSMHTVEVWNVSELQVNFFLWSPMTKWYKISPILLFTRHLKNIFFLAPRDFFSKSGVPISRQSLSGSYRWVFLGQYYPLKGPRCIATPRIFKIAKLFCTNYIFQLIITILDYLTLRQNQRKMF